MTEQIGRSPASQGRATGLRPQPPSVSSQSSVPNAAEIAAVAMIEKLREAFCKVAAEIRFYDGADDEMPSSLPDRYTSAYAALHRAERQALAYASAMGRAAFLHASGIVAAEGGRDATRLDERSEQSPVAKPDAHE